MLYDTHCLVYTGYIILGGVTMVNYQTFNGIQFYQSSPKDYFRHSVGHTTILMHKYVWEYYNGKIPKGYEVHHIDRDRSNNDISNLQLLSREEHRKLHADILSEEEREWKRQNIITKAVPKAIEWHKSEEGKAWHKKQVESRKDNRTLRKLTCIQCGSDFTIFSNRDAKYCSNKCKAAYRRGHSSDLEERVCVICGNLFMTDKYTNVKCCSRECGAVFGHQKRKGN